MRGGHIHVYGGDAARNVVPAFSAGNFSATGAMTWTVDPADVTTFTYSVFGAWMEIQFRLLNTTVGGTVAGNNLKITIPEGRTVASEVALPILASPGGLPTEGAIAFLGIGATFILVQRYAANWIAGANNTDVNGGVRFRIA